VSKTEAYREILRTLDHWDAFLLQESGLPGRRGNIELAQAVAEEGDEELFVRYLSFDPEKAPTNSPHEFLAFCGAVGLGRLVSEGKTEYFETLRARSSDPRWRTREAVAMALQRLGRANMDALLREMEEWSRGNPLEKRAAAAALCEPDLLREVKHAHAVLQILDQITTSIQHIENRKSDEFRALRKGLGYCWSVAAVAAPDKGREMMEKWFSSDDRDIVWIMKQNLRKKRLVRMDAEWVGKWKTRLGM
jgi:3-methyladenine DNA glycosylase AlkC